jgi:hypothetical protein
VAAASSGWRIEKTKPRAAAARKRQTERRM